jgi:mevalonate kinase
MSTQCLAVPALTVTNLTGVAVDVPCGNPLPSSASSIVCVINELYAELDAELSLILSHFSQKPAKHQPRTFQKVSG